MQEGTVGRMQSSAECTVANTAVISDLDNTDRSENVDEDHKKRDVPNRTYNGRPRQNGIRGLNKSSKPTPSQEVKVGANAQKRRGQVVQDVLKGDESVKFYTGIQSLVLSRFMPLFKTLLPYAEK